MMTGCGTNKHRVFSRMSLRPLGKRCERHDGSLGLQAPRLAGKGCHASHARTCVVSPPSHTRSTLVTHPCLTQALAACRSTHAAHPLSSGSTPHKGATCAPGKRARHASARCTLPLARPSRFDLASRCLQSHNWDCGLACAEMVLRALGVPPVQCSLSKLRELVPPLSTSIWTVDLAYTLHAFGVRFKYLTSTLGADPAYEAEPFYKATLDADTIRVNELFAKAETHQVHIERRSVSDDELTELVRAQDHMVITLVDRRLLDRPGATSVSGIVDACFSYCFGGYIGHYVLLLRHDSDRDGFVVHDPAKPASGTFVAASDLHSARRSHGTDEDLLIVPFLQPRKLQLDPCAAAASPAA